MIDTCVMRTRCTPAVLYVVLGIGLMLQTYLLYAPVHGESGLPPGADKVVHICMFGMPAALSLYLGLRWAPLAFAWYAPVSEVIQGTSFVGRDADVKDVVADITGIVLWCALERWLARRSVR